MGDGSEDTHALVLRARSGDRRAYEVLVSRYENGVYGHLLARLGDPERAQEVTQDAFITAWTTLARLEKPASFRSWVIGIGLNLARRRKKEVANLELLEASPERRESGALAAITNERVDAVRRAIEELPENYRDALLLHYFDKQRGREIGKVLGVSEGAVHMILLRARKALAEKLEAFAPE
ncbi:MAG: RNA polymerase sigma factor [Planctomycetes bacterium]|jgi:RNA polymerase sigma-70 factor (ECF subfamily)|nr:RNA polymerase sigma factor [Planctomycetota bacterium]MCL4730265.1 RNA polymerase sigma factor [Planctomycetota bacterium]